jgi:uncharacterized protein (TIGR02246 family)
MRIEKRRYRTIDSRLTLEVPRAMVSPMREDDVIWQAVLESNRAWLSGDAERAGALFADDAVMVAPDLAKVGASRAAMVEGFVQYAAQATTHSFAETKRSIHVRGALAVVTYTYDVDYTFAGTRSRESGQEVLVLAKEAGVWRAVWRTQVPRAASG